MIAAWPWGAYLGEEGLKRGIRVKTSSYTRHHVNITMTQAKAVSNYSNSILANMEATDETTAIVTFSAVGGAPCSSRPANGICVSADKIVNIITPGRSTFIRSLTVDHAEEKSSPNGAGCVLGM
mgnify:CR=1 FL=1